MNFGEGITVIYSLDDIKDLQPVKLSKIPLEKRAKKGGITHKRGDLGVKNHQNKYIKKYIFILYFSLSPDSVSSQLKSKN